MNEEIKNTSTEYSVGSIQILEGLGAIRKGPLMYISNTSEKGFHHLVYEIIDNSTDEALTGYCIYIDMVINKDNSIMAADDGRGIPVDIHGKEGKSALEVVLTVLRTGGRFDKGTYRISGGLHGVGVSCVNALSIYLKAEARRSGRIHMQGSSCGKLLHDIQVIDNTNRTGTMISFKPDDSIFTVMEYKYGILATRSCESAFLNADITLRPTDRRVLKEDGLLKPEVFHSDEGLKEFIRYIDHFREKLIPDVIYIVTERQGIPAEVASTYNIFYNESVSPHVSDINTIEGGTYLAGFRRGLTRMLRKHAEDSKLSEKAKVKIQGDDFREGLTAVISIRVVKPQFEGQTKTKLGNSEVTGAVDMAIGEVLGYYLEEHPKKARIIIDKVILAAQTRYAAHKVCELVQRKPPLTGGGLLGRLTDCSSKDASICELFLVGRDPADGTAKQGRDCNFQAILPLRGKTLNMKKTMGHKIFGSEEIQSIYRMMGVTVGVEGDPKALNMERSHYHKVIIITGVNVDGSHIAALILTLFFRRMHSLVKNGYVYLATPSPCLCRRGKVEEYCWTEQQRQQFILKYRGGNESSVHTQRYKGSGEMNDHQLWDTTMNPKNRILKQIMVDNAAGADQIFTTLMGEDIGPRRGLVEENAIYANIDA